MTICKECEHYYKPQAYHEYCRALVKPNAPERDYVSGGDPRLWRVYWECPEINRQGNCSHFQPKPRRWWQVWRRG